MWGGLNPNEMYVHCALFNDYDEQNITWFVVVVNVCRPSVVRLGNFLFFSPVVLSLIRFLHFMDAGSRA